MSIDQHIADAQLGQQQEIPATPIINVSQNEEAKAHRQYLDSLRNDSSTHANAVSASSASSSTSSSSSSASSTTNNATPAAAAANRPNFSTIDLIDYKMAESKGGEQYVIFLFELCYFYPASTLAQMSQIGLQSSNLSPSVTLVVGKRFAELHAFHSLLDRHFVCLPPFPDRTLTRRMDKSFIEERCTQLQTYMRLILMREDIQKTGWIQHFCGVPTPAARIREARALLQAQLRDADRRRTAMLLQQQQAQLQSQIEAQKKSSSSLSRENQLGSSLASDINPSSSGGLLSASSQPSSLVSSSSPLALESDENAFAPSASEQHEVSDASASSSTMRISASSAQVSSLDQGIEVHSSSTVNLAALALDPSAVVTAEPSRLHSHDDDDIEDSSEPATRSNSFDNTGFDSDEEYSQALSGGLSEAESNRRKKEGSKVHDARGISNHTSPFKANALTSAAHHAQLPNSVVLEFLSRSPVFDMLRFISVDSNTLLCIAADRTVAAKMDSWLSGLFGGKKSDKDVKEEFSTSLVNSASTGNGANDILNPRAALYAFRRNADGDSSMSSALNGHSVSVGGNSDVNLSDAGGAGDFVQSLHLFFPYELTGLEWDPERRWIYLTDARGGLSIFNPSPDFDYTIKLMSVPIFQSQPITHFVSYCSPSMPSGAMILVSNADNNKQIISGFDVQRQAVLTESSFLFNKERGGNAVIQAIAVAAESDRLFIADSNRTISIYDITFIIRTPPKLLHRLANGHASSILSLAWNASLGVLASGGEDRMVVLWKVGNKGGEKTTQLLARLPGMSTRVVSMAWSGDVPSFRERGGLLATGDSTGHVCVWEPRRRGCIVAFRAHSEFVTQTFFTPELTLLTASQDKSAKLWQMA